MALNILEYGEKTAKKFDEKFIQDSVTGFLATNPTQVDFVDTKTVLVTDIEMSGMGDYDRDNGYPIGSITTSKTPYVLTQDRGRGFQIDVMDADEAGIQNATLMAMWQKRYVVPEVDSYTLSKLFSFATAKSHTTSYNPAVGTIYTQLINAMNTAADLCGEDEPLVCFMPYSVRGIVQTSTELSKMLTVSDFKQGAISTKVKTLDNMQFIFVPTARMYTLYDSLNGTDEGQYNGGLVKNSAANNIKYMIMPKNIGKLITKTQNIQVISPQANNTANAWKFNYRRYYDMIVLNEAQNYIVAGYYAS